MHKFLVGLTLIIIILGCNSSNKKENTALKNTYVDMTDMTGLFKNIKCKQKIYSFGLTEETLQNFLTDIIVNESSIENLVLMFYKEEGEIINLYQAGIVTLKNESKVYYALNDGNIEIDKIKSENAFNSLISRIKELKTPTNREMLILEIKSGESTCSIFNNIKSIETLGNRILF